MKISSMRVAASETITALAYEDPRTILVSTDSLLVIKGQKFKEQFPERCLELGIAEQNGVNVCAGLAAAGMRPYLATYAGFITMRACEQVRTFVAYTNLPVTLIGANGGIGAGEREGVTHQFTEDLSILRAIPGITIFVPADAGQTAGAVRAASEIEGPVYIRIGSGRDPVIYDEEVPFQPGKIRIVRDKGQDCVLFACGSLLLKAMEAADILRSENINITVVDVSTLRPLDRSGILKVIRNIPTIVTVEDHTINGGMGSAVCELLSEASPRRIKRMGLQDCFARSGESEELLNYYGLGTKDIIRTIKEQISLEINRNEIT